MSFFVPSVHMSRPFDPDDPMAGRLPFGATRRRPKRKKTPIPWTCNIPYMCPILLVSLSGFLVLLSGVAMSVLGYYPAYFSREAAFNGTHIVMLENSMIYYHIRNFSFVGPILMGIGCFAMMTAGVIFFEFRDKYFRDLPQNEIKTMSKQDVRNLLVDQFRHNYFRGIPIPLIFPDDSENAEKQEQVPKKDIAILGKEILQSRKASSVSMGNSLAPMFSSEFPEIQRAHSTSTLPSVQPAVILSPLNLFQDEAQDSHSVNLDLNSSYMDRGSLVNVFKVVTSPLSRRASTGVENPAYLSDNDSGGSFETHLGGRHENFRGTGNPSGSPSPADGQFSSVIVHAASIHFPPELNDTANVSTLEKCKSLQGNIFSDSIGSNPNIFSAYKNRSCPVFKDIKGYPTKAHWEMTRQMRKRENGKSRKSFKKRQKAKKNRKRVQDEHASFETIYHSSFDLSGIVTEKWKVCKNQRYNNETHKCSETMHTQSPVGSQNLTMQKIGSLNSSKSGKSSVIHKSRRKSDSSVRFGGTATQCTNVVHESNLPHHVSVTGDSSGTCLRRASVASDASAICIGPPSVTPIANLLYNETVTPEVNLMETTNVTAHSSAIRSTPDVSASRCMSVSPMPSRRRCESFTSGHRDNIHKESLGFTGLETPGSVSHIGSG